MDVLPVTEGKQAVKKSTARVVTEGICGKRTAVEGRFGLGLAQSLDVSHTVTQ